MSRNFIQKSKTITKVSGYTLSDDGSPHKQGYSIEGKRSLNKALAIIHKADPRFMATESGVTYENKMYHLSIDDFWKYATPVDEDNQ